MDFRATNERQQEALWRVFLMFVVMALLIIRTGLMSRGIVAVLPLEEEAWDSPPPSNKQASSTSPDGLYQATLVLLCLAEAAGHLIALNVRAVWELLNQPTARVAQEGRLQPASLCEHEAPGIDSS